MKKLIIALFLVGTIFSCQKDEQPEPLEVGNTVNGIYAVSCCLSTDYLEVEMINDIIVIQALGSGDVDVDGRFDTGYVSGQIMSDGTIECIIANVNFELTKV